MLALVLLIPLAVGAYTDYRRLAVSPGILGIMFLIGVSYNILSFPDGIGLLPVGISIVSATIFMVFIVYKSVWLRPMDAALVWCIGCVLPFLVIGWLPIWAAALGFTVPVLFVVRWFKGWLGAPNPTELPFFTCFLVGYLIAIGLFWNKVQMFKYMLP